MKNRICYCSALPQYNLPTPVTDVPGYVVSFLAVLTKSRKNFAFFEYFLKKREKFSPQKGGVKINLKYF